MKGQETKTVHWRSKPLILDVVLPSIPLFLLWALLLLLPVTELQAARLTPWDPWYWRRLEHANCANYLRVCRSRTPRFVGAWRNGDPRLAGTVDLEARGHWLPGGSRTARRPMTRSTCAYRERMDLRPCIPWTQLRFGFEPGNGPDAAGNSCHGQRRRRFPKHGEGSSGRMGRANLLLNWKNLLLQAGYDSLRFGNGTRGVLHWDSHSSPMPLLRIGTRGPWETSWGYWTFSHQVVQLEQDRHVPYARLSGWRLGWSSERRFEFGLSRSWQVGWVQGEQYRFYQLVGELYDPSRFFKDRPDHDDPDEDYSGGDYRNQQLVTIGRLKFPESGTGLYWEWGREDHEHDLHGISKGWEHTQAKVLGWRQQYGTRRDWYTILEWADTLQPRNALTRPPGVLGWYNHNLYQNGWTYRGVILGHPMGADAEMLAFSLGQLTPALGWQLTLEQQRRGVRSVEMENSSASRIEEHRLFELDAQWRDGPREWRTLITTAELRNPGRRAEKTLHSQTLLLSWSRQW